MLTEYQLLALLKTDELMTFEEVCEVSEWERDATAKLLLTLMSWDDIRVTHDERGVPLIYPNPDNVEKL